MVARMPAGVRARQLAETADVDAVLRNGLQGLLQFTGAVIGAADPLKGQVPRGFVVLKAGVSADGRVSAAPFASLEGLSTAAALARTVASGYREMSLEEECRSAVSVLAAADVAVRLDCDHTDLPVHVNTVLATV